MIKYSFLFDKLPEYPFARIGKLVKEIEEKEGIKVINARIGIPDREAPKVIKELMAKFILQEKSTYGYPIDVYPERGIPELIEAIIEDYRKKYGRGLKLRAENIAITNWSKEVLHNLVRLFAPGNILIPEPIYPAYVGATILSNHKIKYVPTFQDDNWLPNFEFKRGDVAFYFCDPNNPTGSIANEKFYFELLEKMKKKRIAGIFDKAYKDYIFEKSTLPISITQIPELINYGFEVVSFSKHYNFVGIGIGFIVSSKENIERWLKFAGHFSQGVEWYKQKVAVEALKNPEVKNEIKKYFDELRERQEIFVKGLNELGLNSPLPKATPYLWVKVPQGYDDEEFVLGKMLPKAHVAFMPGSYFGKSGKGFLRATLFLSKEDIKEALKRIKNVKDW